MFKKTPPNQTKTRLESFTVEVLRLIERALEFHDEGDLGKITMFVYQGLTFPGKGSYEDLKDPIYQLASAHRFLKKVN